MKKNNESTSKIKTTRTIYLFKTKIVLMKKEE